MATESGVDGVFMDYLARTVDTASHRLHNHHSHINRNSSNSSNNNDDREQEFDIDKNEVEASSPELSRKV